MFGAPSRVRSTLGTHGLEHTDELRSLSTYANQGNLMSITIHSPSSLPVIVAEAPTYRELAQFVNKVHADSELKFSPPAPHGQVYRAVARIS